MNGSTARSLFLGLAAACIVGCTTYPDSSGRSILGAGSGSARQPSPQQLAEARRDAKLTELDNTTNRLRTELDAMSISINGISRRIDDFSRQSDARSADLATLRNEVSTLRSELNATRTEVSALPGRFAKLLEENNKTILAEVNKTIQSRVSAESSRSSSRTRSGGSGKYYEHEVGSGQTLSEIAKVYGVSVSEIMAENNLSNAALIRVGQKLLIPVK